MRLYLILILIGWTLGACRTKPTETKLNEPQGDFQVLLSNVKVLQKGYTYDLVGEDTEGCYIPDKNADSLFYNPPFPILGQLTSGTIHSLIHFEPGDDLYPVIRTFDNLGHFIDSETIVFGNCAGWDCDFDACEEKFTILDQNTIEDVITLVSTPCDSLGNKNPGLTTKYVWRKTITVNDNGQLTIKDEKNIVSLPEDFSTFYKRFATDSLFQIARVKFPFTTMTWESGEDAPKKELKDKKNWRFYSFKYDESYATRQLDAFKQEVKFYGDTAKIELRGVDNGIFIDYEFIPVDGKWMLVLEKDYSN